MKVVLNYKVTVIDGSFNYLRFYKDEKTSDLNLKEGISGTWTMEILKGTVSIKTF